MTAEDIERRHETTFSNPDKRDLGDSNDRKVSSDANMLGELDSSMVRDDYQGAMNATTMNFLNDSKINKALEK